MNWNYLMLYVGTRVAAALGLIATGWFLAEGNLFLALIGWTITGMIWLAWKWGEER